MFYAVKKGRTPGIFTDWDTCKASVDKFPGAEFKSFRSEDEANAYLNGKDIIKENSITPYLAQGVTVAFVDGSFDETKNEYGSGVFIITPDLQTVSLRFRGNNPKYTEMRNVTGEVIAVMSAITYAKEHNLGKIMIFHDYEGLKKWASYEWRAKTPITQFYLNFIERYRNLVQFDFVKVKGHSNNKYNDKADELAASAIADEIPMNIVLEGKPVSTEGEH